MPAQKTCPYCGVIGGIIRWGQTTQKRSRYRCSACSKTFTNRTGTIRHRTRLNDRQWGLLAQLISVRTCPSGADLGRIFSKHERTGQRYRRAVRKLLPDALAGPPLAGPAESDETTMKHIWIGGAKSRKTRQIKLSPLQNRNSAMLTNFVDNLLEKNASVFTDEWRGYRELKYSSRQHFTICHSKEFVSKECSGIHTNGIEGVWGHAKPLARHTYRGYPNLTDFLKEICFLFNFSYSERKSYLLARFFRLTTNT
ncbi:MAG: transposase [Patescibacteria group bacterium]